MLDGRFSHVTSYADTRQATGEITGGFMLGWISVTEELPPLNMRFDVWDNHHKKRLADHGAFTGPWDDDFRRECMLIKGYTHWMYIPEAPVASNNSLNLTPANAVAG